MVRTEDILLRFSWDISDLVLPFPLGKDFVWEAVDEGEDGFTRLRHFSLENNDSF